ncbi:MAG TPA: hypothetical protein VJG30_04320 [Candidatus Nanoarchaeia archaeon]|nr:hypothetical protein [Candidatus Nanoarchaeia archaeon]
MQALYIFAVIWLAMIAHSFWEASVEGRNAWDKNKYGWKWQIAHNISLTRYHFWLFFVHLPLIIIILPMVVAGFSVNLFGILLSAYTSGLVIEDFFWFVVNTELKFKESWHPIFASYYPWIVIGKFRIPVIYILGIVLSLLSWFLFVR